MRDWKLSRIIWVADRGFASEANSRAKEYPHAWQRRALAEGYRPPSDPADTHSTTNTLHIPRRVPATRASTRRDTPRLCPAPRFRGSNPESVL